MQNWDDESWKDHLRNLGYDLNYGQAVYEIIDRDNQEGLDYHEKWRVADEIMTDYRGDALVIRFEELLGVPSTYYYRIKSTVDWVRHDFEQEMQQIDEGYKDHIRRLGHEHNYHLAVYDYINHKNWEGLDPNETWIAVDMIMAADFVPRTFEEELGVPK